MKLRNAHEPFDKVLVLSTAHVPNNNPDWGENYAVPVDFGWVRWAGEPVDWTPDWLMPSGTFQASAGLKSKATSKRSPRPSRGGTPSSWEEARDIVNLAVMNMAYEAYLGLVTRLPEQKK